MTEKVRSFFCPLPWKHLSVEPSGNVYSCCDSIKYDALGNLKEVTLKSIWEGEKITNLRNSFLEGKIPTQCGSCVQSEKDGLISTRLAALGKYPLKVHNKQDLSPSLEYLGLRLDNLCNLSCRICHKGVSTAWYSDAAALGEKVPSGIIESISNPVERKKFFYELSEKIKILYLAGGEPFLSENVLELLDILKAEGKKDLEIFINTNFSVAEKFIQRMLNRLSWFNNVYLDLSLDGTKARGEYMRKGQNWGHVEKNISYCRENFPHIKLKLAPTISLMNFHHLPEYFHYMIEVHHFSPRDFKLSLLSDPAYYQASLLPKELINFTEGELNKFQKHLLLKFEEQESMALIVQIRGIINAIKIAPEKSITDLERNHFKERTKVLDKIRNEKFSDVFPELGNFFA
jgi:radical SAM protein with 4Fe4S-binding SPASM domain